MDLDTGRQEPKDIDNNRDRNTDIDKDRALTLTWAWALQKLMPMGLIPHGNLFRGV